MRPEVRKRAARLVPDTEGQQASRRRPVTRARHLLATLNAGAPDRRVFVLMEMMGAQTRVVLRRESLRRP